jgi:hypothetical protein
MFSSRGFFKSLIYMRFIGSGAARLLTKMAQNPADLLMNKTAWPLDSPRKLEHHEIYMLLN